MRTPGAGPDAIAAGTDVGVARERPVVAGIAHGAVEAVAEWAAAEAAARGSALRLVHVRPPPPSTPIELAAPFGLPAYSPYSPLLFDPQRRDGFELLVNAMRHALGVAPELSASGELVTGSVRRGLRESAGPASLLVVGGPSASGGAERRWCGDGMIRGVRCPTVLVPAVRSSAVPRVVVLLDRSGATGAALEFAFRAAEQRRVELVAVPAPGFGWSYGGAGRHQWRLVQALLVTGLRWPSVRWSVAHESDAGAAATVLRRCSLLVVPAPGRPGRGRGAAALVDALPGRAAPPIAVVPAARRSAAAQES